MSGIRGYGPADALGRLVNVYAVREADAPKWRSSAGLKTFAAVGRSNARGFVDVSGTLYAVYGDKAVTITTGGVVTTLTGASIAGTAPVTMARNRAAPTPDIVAVTSSAAYTLTSTTVASYPDADLPSPNSVSFLDGYFLFTIGDGRIFASDLNSTAVDALSFATAEAKADGLLRGMVKGQLFLAMGPASIEAWQNVGESPFPLRRSFVVPVGLLSPHAAAGDEDGWEHPIVFVASDNTVRRLNGNVPERVSFSYLERQIEAVADKTTLRASVYTFGGQAFWALSSPTWTWEMNMATGFWNERASKGLTRWRAERSVLFNGRWLIGDTQGTSLLQVSEATRTEIADEITSTIESANSSDFPARALIASAAFRFNAGVGLEAGADPIQTDPRVSVSWSNDGGATYGRPVIRKLGRQGKYRQVVDVSGLGQTSPHGRRYRIQWSDPVDVTFLGGSHEGRRT